MSTTDTPIRRVMVLPCHTCRIDIPKGNHFHVTCGCGRQWECAHKGNHMNAREIPADL